MYHVQRFDCGEWWTFQSTDNYITAVYLRDNAYTGLTSEDDANFLARAYIAGYKQGKGV